MSILTPEPELSEIGAPAPLIRTFGWAVLGVLFVYLFNDFLYVRFDWPDAAAAFSGGGARSIVQAALYAIALLAAVAYVIRTPNRSLRWESAKISDFNRFIIRSCFWAVLLIGIVDTTISLMRVEDLLSIFFGDEMVRDFGRAYYVGSRVHIPLMFLGVIIGALTRGLGFIWLALLIVAAELTIVITRFIFSYEQALMGDLVRYWYASLFLFASAYTLLEEGHVRVDVFYTNFTPKRKGMVNAIGAVLLGISTCWVILVVGLGGKQSIINSPLANFEVTQTGGLGLYVKYQMAGFLAIFASTMMIQFVSYLFDAYADFREEPGGHEHDSHAVQ